MTRRMIVMLLLVGAVFGGFFAMRALGDRRSAQALEHAPVPPAAISTTRAKRQAWQSRLEAPGTVVAVHGTLLTSEAGGLVTGILFESGAEVRKGALLVQLDSGDEHAELDRLQAQADLAELNRKRRERLLGLEAISQSDYDTARSEHAVATAAVKAQRARLAQKDIRAPFDGTLGIRRVNLGEYLAPGGPIVTLQSLDPVDVDFELPEQRVGQVRTGFRVSMVTEAFADRSFEGEVVAIEPRIEAGSRNFRVRARVPNPDRVLRPGQFGKVRLELPVSQDVVVVPRTAIDYSAYGNAVYVVQKKKDAPANPEAGAAEPPANGFEVVQRFVETGAVRGDFVAIVRGLKDGEEIASSGLLKLRSGQPVVINNAVQSPATTEPRPPQG